MVSTTTIASQNYGEIFTRRWIVDALMDLVGYTVDRDLGSLTLVEPSAGTGAFLFPAVERLLQSAKDFGREPYTLKNSIRAWELQPQSARYCRQVVQQMLTESGSSSVLAEEISCHWIVEGDFLRPEGDLFTPGSGTVEADIVLGNPPYIRLEDLPDDVTRAYRRRWTSMVGRADIYVGFIERSLSMLRPDGKVGFICADRWMRNQYGDKLRRIISNGFAVDAVWIMHDVDAFESRVSAYPAITVFRRGNQKSVVAADTTEAFGEQSAEQLVRWSLDQNEGEFRGPGVYAHRLPHWFSGEESWPVTTPERLRLIEYLNDAFSPLHDPITRTRVGIGVATGADRVFVTEISDVVEDDRMLRLSMAKDLRTGTFQWSGSLLVNPWDKTGSLVRLDQFPRLSQYLAEHGEGLRSRHVSRKSPRNWYRTIDKVDFELIDRPKLLIQDMSLVLSPVLERGGHYPHHNLYYIVSDCWDMEVLGGLLLSRIAQAYMEAYCVKMRGGTLRLQSQFLKRLRVPHPSAIPAHLAETLRAAFRTRDRHLATLAASQAYSVNPKEFGLEVDVW